MGIQWGFRYMNDFIQEQILFNVILFCLYGILFFGFGWFCIVVIVIYGEGILYIQVQIQCVVFIFRVREVFGYVMYMVCLNFRDLNGDFKYI